MDYPKGLPKRYRGHWRQPWRRRAKWNPGFRRALNRLGYLTPHFSIDEGRCKDAARSRPPSHAMRRRQRSHAFNLEKLRHRIGDQPIAITSWYRTPAHNAAVGGASQSKHKEAIATDHPREWVERVGRALVLEAANAVFANGGMGTYPGGALHFDSRGYRARWTTW